MQGPSSGSILFGLAFKEDAVGSVKDILEGFPCWPRAYRNCIGFMS